MARPARSHGQENERTLQKLAEWIADHNPELVDVARAGIEYGLRLGMRRAMGHLENAEKSCDAPSVAVFIRRVLQFELEKGLIASIPLEKHE